MYLILLQNWDGADWVNDMKSTATYDDNNNMIEVLQTTWSDSNWVYDWKNTFIYDGNTNLIEQLSQYWDGANWLNDLKFTFSFISITDIEINKDENITYTLSNNYPNPFNPSTTINYSIPDKSNVLLKVYDILGCEVAILVNKEQTQGKYEIRFDASQLTSGIYFYRIEAHPVVSWTGNPSSSSGQGFVETKKMLLLR